MICFIFFPVRDLSEFVDSNKIEERSSQSTIRVHTRHAAEAPVNADTQPTFVLELSLFNCVEWVM